MLIKERMRIIICTIFLLISFKGFSQENNYDYIYLESGEKLAGFLMIEGKEITALNEIIILNKSFLKDTVLVKNIASISLIGGVEIYKKEIEKKECSDCLGNGKIKKNCIKFETIRSWVVDPKTQKGKTVEEKKVHKMCGGKGYYFKKCKKCNGQGKI